MSISTDDLQAQVLGLPEAERARLLELLIASLEPRTPAQQAWIAEAQRRRETVRSGEVQLVPADAALARVRTRLA
ncbi:addiction module protein [Pelomonas aquatica]|jgi:hypothetical protein|uniref:Acyl-protein synthetase n=1 Tax=Pelomonas aquatica TaxID=431058 RepID=A0A9X4R771_9BURK|nr:addiction module protein [Pelomonas aquatica]MCY4756356.1 addiction module protein [Pelomonas aquatica]MDG0865094.1 acyl-protein synthetase [Pelomonas aquatica]